MSDFWKQKYLEAQAVQELPEPPTEDTRAHLHTFTSGVIIPFVQALVSGALAGLAVLIYAWMLKAPDPWKWGLGALAGVIVLAWLSMLARWLNLTSPLERITHRDINQDGYIGQPPTVRVEVVSQDGKRAQFAELPTSKAKMIEFSRGVLSGTSISEAKWTGAGAVFSVREFRAVRDMFIVRGWMRWRNPEYHDQGVELAPAGRSIMRQFASESGAPSPTLSRDDT